MENLKRIKEDLGLTLTQTAELFNVNRKTIYDLFEGLAPELVIVSRINMLADVLDNAQRKNINIKCLKSFWNVPLIDNLSFRETLNDKNSDENMVKIVLLDKLNEISNRYVPHRKLNNENNLYSNTLLEYERIAN